MSRQTFIHTHDDIRWLLTTHLNDKKLLKRPKSAVLHGHHESTPDKIELYDKYNPLITDEPYQTINMEDENGNAGN